MKEPTTADDWRATVAMAEVALQVESARLYGLIEGGPTINIARCEEMIARGRTLGYVATEAEKAAAVRAFVQAWGPGGSAVK